MSYLEIANWYDLKADSDGSYTLILRTRNVEKLLNLLESMFKAQEIPVEIARGLRRLMITVK